jgi:hypothetical protein
VWYTVRNLRCTVTTDSVLANSKTQNAFVFPVHISSRLPPSGKTCKYATAPSTKKAWRDSVPIDMLLSAVSVLVVAQSSSEVPEGVMNYPVYVTKQRSFCLSDTTNNATVYMLSPNGVCVYGVNRLQVTRCLS